METSFMCGDESERLWIISSRVFSLVFSLRLHVWSVKFNLMFSAASAATVVHMNLWNALAQKKERKKNARVVKSDIPLICGWMFHAFMLVLPHIVPFHDKQSSSVTLGRDYLRMKTFFLVDNLIMFRWRCINSLLQKSLTVQGKSWIIYGWKLSNKKNAW